MTTEDEADEAVDPRRELWRRGSYEIVGDWLRPASVAVLDRVAEATGTSLGERSLLDLATGTGAVAIEAARRGASVVGVDLTDELVDIARRRAADAGVDVRFVVGDFDHLGDVLGDETFDLASSAFGVIFAPDAEATLTGLAERVRPGGHFGVSGWDPAGVFAVPGSLLDLFPERPPMPDMGTWTTDIAALCDGTPWTVVATVADELPLPFASVADGAQQLERWSGGWTQLLETFDGLGVGDEARARFREHLAAFSSGTDDGIALHARHHTTVLRRR